MIVCRSLTKKKVGGDPPLPQPGKGVAVGYARFLAPGSITAAACDKPGGKFET